MNHWNYRVVKHDCEEDFYEIKEIYYDDNGNITAYAEVGSPYGESVVEVKKCLELMLRALDKPVINIKDLNFK